MPEDRRGSHDEDEPVYNPCSLFRFVDEKCIHWCYFADRTVCKIQIIFGSMIVPYYLTGVVAVFCKGVCNIIYRMM